MADASGCPAGDLADQSHIAVIVDEDGPAEPILKFGAERNAREVHIAAGQDQSGHGIDTARNAYAYGGDVSVAQIRDDAAQPPEEHARIPARPFADPVEHRAV
jgi:hypothetical protein